MCPNRVVNPDLPPREQTSDTIRKNHVFHLQVPLVIPVISLLISGYLVVAPVIRNPSLEILITLAVLALGLIVYVPFVFYNVKVPLLGNVCKFSLQLFFVARDMYELRLMNPRPTPINKTLTAVLYTRINV